MIKKIFSKCLFSSFGVVSIFCLLAMLCLLKLGAQQSSVNSVIKTLPVNRVNDVQPAQFIGPVGPVATSYPYQPFVQSKNDIIVIPSLHARMGKGQSYYTGYQTAELTLGLFNRPCYNFSYLDCRFHYIEDSAIKGFDSQYAGNIGIGFREYFGKHRETYGAYIYYDFQCLPQIKMQQIGLGIEFLGHAFDFRSNAYVPIGKQEIFQERQTFIYDDDFFTVGTFTKRALWRYEFEVGKSLFCNKIYLAVGPYFFGSTRSCCCGGLEMGGMGRLSINLTNCLNLDLYASIDPVFKSCYQMELTLIFPFSRCFRRCRNFFERVRRNDLIMVKKNCFFESNF